jgi:hypothetical protein
MGVLIYRSKELRDARFTNSMRGKRCQKKCESENQQ